MEDRERPARCMRAGVSLGAWSWLVVGLALAFAFAAPVAAAAPALTVVRAWLRASASDAGTGGFVVRALVRDTPGTGAFPGALLADGATLRVQAGVDFDATVAVTGCRRHPLSRTIVCVGPDRTTRVTLRRRPVAGAYVLDVTARHLPAAVTGTANPHRPVTMTIAHADRDRTDVITDCTVNGVRRLTCRELGRPNIIVINTDDQRWDTLPVMPHTMDLLVAQGVTFTRSFVTTPLCTPSRASLFSGRYAHNHGVLENGPPTGGAGRFIGPDRSTIAVWLQRAGYRTGLFGKYLTAYNRLCPPQTARCYQPPGWDEWHAFVQQAYYDYQLSENGQISSYGTTPDDYSTDVLARKAVEFVRAAHGQPFFLYLAPTAPHAEGVTFPVPAARHAGTFDSIAPWRPPSFDEEDASDKPPWVANAPRAADLIAPTLTYGTLDDVFRLYQLESLLAVDDAVAALQAALDETGQVDDTVFVYTSDNGYMWGEHRQWAAKLVPYDESMRVPLVVRFPRASSGARTEDTPILNVDLAPTLAALAGVVPPTPVDGLSFAGLWQGAPVPDRVDVLVEAWTGLNADDPTSYAGVRGGRWKYVRYAGQEQELYDLATDPYELDNRAGDPTAQDTVAALRARLGELTAAGH